MKKYQFYKNHNQVFVEEFIESNCLSELNGHIWYIYEGDVGPEDYWDGWRSYSFNGHKEHLGHIRGTHPEDEGNFKLPSWYDLNCENDSIERLSLYNLSAKIKDLEKLLKYCTWEGDIRDGWFVSNNFGEDKETLYKSLCLGMKQDNNGHTFMISQDIPLHKLERFSLDCLPVPEEPSYVFENNTLYKLIYYSLNQNPQIKPIQINHPHPQEIEYIYFIEAIGTNKIKIGLSKNPYKRLHNMQTGSAANLKLLGCIKTEQGMGLKKEKEFHNTFKNLHSEREWFMATKELRNYIKSNSAIFHGV